jgi:hypothetical protein
MSVKKNKKILNKNNHGVAIISLYEWHSFNLKEKLNWNKYFFHKFFGK